MAQRLERDPEYRAFPAGTIEDKELTLAFQRGEKGAYQAIHDRYADRVHRVCRRMLGNPQDAQEAAQESFLKIYQALGRFNGRYQLGSWIARIATNVCLDQLRARARRPIDDVQLEVSEMANDARVEQDDPEYVLLRKSEGRQVHRTLLGLPPMHRAAIILRDIEGLSYLEIAATLNMSENQVKALLHRARAKFKTSWMSRALPALLPARLWQRIRFTDHLATGNEHVVQTMSSSINVAASCGSTLAQCGQYVGERAAAGIAALVVSSAAVAGAGVGVGVANTSPVPEPSPSVVAAVAEGEGLTEKAAPAKRERKEAPAEEVVADTPSDVPGEPAPSASPSPEPTATAPAAPPPEGEGDQTEQPEEPPTGFFPVIGFDWDDPVPARVPRSHEASVRCKGPVVFQRLETAIEDRKGVAHPALLELSIGSTNDQLGMVSLELTVDPGENEIYYSGSGSLSEDSGASKTRDVKYTGEYGTFNQQARATDLPQSGDFSVSLGLDCAAQSVVTESVILATE